MRFASAYYRRTVEGAVPCNFRNTIVRANVGVGAFDDPAVPGCGICVVWVNTQKVESYTEIWNILLYISNKCAKIN